MAEILATGFEKTVQGVECGDLVTDCVECVFGCCAVVSAEAGAGGRGGGQGWERVVVCYLCCCRWWTVSLEFLEIWKIVTDSGSA